jgi:photosystem II stability/assembly factor-like uncharacterized protein
MLTLQIVTLAAAVWAAGSAPVVDPVYFQSLHYRNVGPQRGGRVTAVAGVRSQPGVFYMGATGGGVWRTSDFGVTWQPIADGRIPNGSIGAIAVAESDPNIVYVGTGSAAIRSNVIHGRGVYRSSDGGKTWQFSGLRNAGQIGAIRVHPKNPNLVYVAVLGQPFLHDTARLSFPAGERGLYRSNDGGKTWTRCLYINDRTGIISLSMNPANPGEIYAGAWQAERKPWTIISGGPASHTGIYKTTDGGDTWQHLTKGLPQDLIGKVDVDVSPARPSRVYAILEAPGKQSGVYRSDDSGASWTLISDQANLVARPFYYTYIDADPKNPDIVYVNNLSFYRSTDAGKSWTAIPTPHGDNHGMWIHPDHPEIFIQANDGGANVTQNGGRTWSSIYNQPTAEIYQVAVDNQFPYRIYGAQQDNNTLIVMSNPERPRSGDDPLQFWMNGPGCETGPVIPHPTRPHIIYGSCKGEFSRLNLQTGQEKNHWVHPQNRYGHAARDIRYRHQRVSPMDISPHDERVIYYGSQYVHRTRDEGVTWEIISPDLTANEPDKQGISGEPITRDITGEEVYSTLYAIRESALEPGVIWAGANDGPVHVTRDNGKSWTNVTPRDLPPGGRVQNIELSPHRKGSAYIAVYRYLLGDFRPYIYLSNDYGKSWSRLTEGENGIPSDCPVRVVREDPDRSGLLYAGTEFGMFISFDQGKRWQSFQINLPVTPVTDIRVSRKDLVLSTMGRGFWVLDNLTPLHQLDSSLRVPPTHLFTPLPAFRRQAASGVRGRAGAEYSPAGAAIDYHLKALPQGDLKLEILDSKGAVIRAYSSASSSPPAAATASRRPAPARPLIKRAGTHRFYWDLRHEGAGGAGPLAVPGIYQVRLTAPEFNRTVPLEVRIDPRLAADGVTQQDLEEQLDLNLKLRDAMRDARALAARIDRALNERRQADDGAARRLREIHSRLVTAGGAYPQPMLIDQLQSIARMAGEADQKVGASAFSYYRELRQELDAYRAEVDKLKP